MYISFIYVNCGSTYISITFIISLQAGQLVEEGTSVGAETIKRKVEDIKDQISKVTDFFFFFALACFSYQGCWNVFWILANVLISLTIMRIV